MSLAAGIMGVLELIKSQFQQLFVGFRMNSIT
jgi:hypothetical protein